jgi:hypothetical protein
LAKGTKIVFRIDRSAARFLSALIVLLIVACTPGRSARIQTPLASDGDVQKRVQAIQLEAKRIDGANDASPTARLQRLTKDAPHWQFSGLFESSAPLLVNARFSEGQVVREEAYYFLRGCPILGRVEKWWDVDDPGEAPHPSTRQDFYIENERTICYVVEVASSPPVTRTDSSGQAASVLIERSRLIAKILFDGAKDSAMRDFLQKLSEAELLQPEVGASAAKNH